jgi:hypothetical protein
MFRDLGDGSQREKCRGRTERGMWEGCFRPFRLSECGMKNRIQLTVMFPSEEYDSPRPPVFVSVCAGYACVISVVGFPFCSYAAGGQCVGGCGGDRPRSRSRLR